MKLRFGVTVASSEQLAELPSLAKVDFLELPSMPGGMAGVNIPRQWKKRVFRISGRRDASTLSSLVDAGSAMQQEFFRMFSRCCADYARFGGAEITLGIEWDMALNDPDFADGLRQILRCCFGVVNQYGLQLDAELRIPGNAIGDPLKFVRFRDSLLIPVRTLIDLHPHEPGALEAFEEFSAKMHFDCSKLRISYDASGGNYLTPKLLERIFSGVRPVGVEVPEVSFYPGKHADRDAFAALESVIP